MIELPVPFRFDVPSLQTVPLRSTGKVEELGLDTDSWGATELRRTGSILLPFLPQPLYQTEHIFTSRSEEGTISAPSKMALHEEGACALVSFLYSKGTGIGQGSQVHISSRMYSSLIYFFIHHKRLLALVSLNNEDNCTGLIFASVTKLNHHHRPLSDTVMAETAWTWTAFTAPLRESPLPPAFTRCRSPNRAAANVKWCHRPASELCGKHGNVVGPQNLSLASF